MQVPAPFDYERASSVEDAVALLERHGEDARLIAGGHSLGTRSPRSASGSPRWVRRTRCSRPRRTPSVAAPRTRRPSRSPVCGPARSARLPPISVVRPTTSGLWPASSSSGRCAAPSRAAVDRRRERHAGDDDGQRRAGDEEPILSAALQAGIPYVGLVASRRRGPAVLASLAVDDGLRTSVHTPAGFDIGPRSAPEVALSILAEIVSTQRIMSARRTPGTFPAEDPDSSTPDGATERRPATTRDPICGMTVVAANSSLHVDTPAGPVFFCGTGCRTAYLDNPADYPP